MRRSRYAIVRRFQKSFATTDCARRNAAVVAAPVLLRLQMHAEQAFEQERDDDEQRIRQMREAGLLPLFHRAEKVGAARRIGHAQEPAEELAAQPFDDGLTRRGSGVAVDRHPRGLRERRVEQLRDRAFRQRPRRFRFFGDRVEMLDDLVVHRIEQQQVFAFGDEVVAQAVVDQNVEHGDVARPASWHGRVPVRRGATNSGRRESGGSRRRRERRSASSVLTRVDSSVSSIRSDRRSSVSARLISAVSWWRR